MLTDYERYQLEWMIEHGHSLKQAVRESREASAKLAENNSGTDAPDGKDER